MHLIMAADYHASFNQQFEAYKKKSSLIFGQTKLNETNYPYARQKSIYFLSFVGVISPIQNPLIFHFFLYHFHSSF